MQVDERLPMAVMVEEQGPLQRTRLGVERVLRGGVDEVAVGVAGAGLGEPENVIGPLLAAGQEHGSEVGARAAFLLALPPGDERILVGIGATITVVFRCAKERPFAERL
jgi:hypothetical protein